MKTGKIILTGLAICFLLVGISSMSQAQSASQVVTLVVQPIVDLQMSMPTVSISFGTGDINRTSNPSAPYFDSGIKDVGNALVTSNKPNLRLTAQLQSPLAGFHFRLRGNGVFHDVTETSATELNTAIGAGSSTLPISMIVYTDGIAGAGSFTESITYTVTE